MKKYSIFLLNNSLPLTNVIIEKITIPISRIKFIIQNAFYVDSRDLEIELIFLKRLFIF